jgi:hypothetical protein
LEGLLLVLVVSNSMILAVSWGLVRLVAWVVEGFKRPTIDGNVGDDSLPSTNGI